MWQGEDIKFDGAARTYHLSSARLCRPQRWLLAGAVTVAAAAHIPVIEPHLEEAPYMGVLFIVFVAHCSGLALASVVSDSVALYTVSALTCGLAIVA